MKRIAHSIACLWILLLVGCGGHVPPQQFIVLLDTSGSIEPGAQADAVKAIGDLAKQLHRGDSIAVIPITSDAENETEGAVIRFTVPTTRKAYDQDLRRFNNQMHDALQRLAADAAAHPGIETDILGTLELARQELSASHSVNTGMIIVLSDFILEDQVHNFRTDPALANETSARNLADQLAKERHFTLHAQWVFLGGLRSKELRSLSEARRNAIRAFWDEYLRAAGAETQYATDGPGLLAEFLRIRDESSSR
jgi:hypothetical protein